MEVRIYGRDLFRRGQIENQTSLIWTRKFYEPGTFELHAPITDENLYLLQEGNIIGKKDPPKPGLLRISKKKKAISKTRSRQKGVFCRHTWIDA